MPNEYYAVVLKFSPRRIELGFAGESAPNVDITPDSPTWKQFLPSYKVDSERQYPAYLMTKSHSLEPEDRAMVIESIELTPECRKLVDRYNLDLDENRWTNWHHNNYNDLARLVKHCVSSRLLISLSKCKFMVVDTGMLAVTKHQFSSAMFGQKAGVAITFLPHSPLCAISAGVDSAIIVNFDWDNCWVAVSSDLRLLLVSTFPEFSIESLHYAQAAKDSNLAFHDADLLLYSPLEPDLLETDEHTLCGALKELPKLIARLIMRLDIDVRPEVARNVIFLGEVAQVAGFKSMFISRLQAELPAMTVSGKQSLDSWAGASLYCTTTLLREKHAKWKHKEVSKDKFDADAWIEVLETSFEM